MNKKNSLFILLLAVLSGCGSKKQKSTPTKYRNTNLAYTKEDTDLDIPLAHDELALSDLEVRNLFDQDLDEFISLSENEETEYASLSNAGQSPESRELAWESVEQEDGFPVVYFDFDRYSVKNEQQNVVTQTAQHAEKIVQDMAQEGKHPVIVIEGHACHSAGSAVYNLALSERRAKAVADWFVKTGVPRENIKIVGRGQEVPAMRGGKPVDGSREEQWPNRRAEVHVIYS